MEPHDVFFAPPAQITTSTIRLSGEEHRHLSHSLRKRLGERIAVVDGCGSCFTVEITRITRSFSEGRILARREMWGEPRLRLTVAAAVPKGSRLEVAIEKGTEIGVARFVPLKAERSVAAASPSKVERWRRLALAAMKQSRRSVLPDVTEEMAFEDAVDRLRSASLRFVTSSEGGRLESRFDLPACEEERLSAVVLIGPEGGFSREELDRAEGAGFQPLSLGPRRLRVETAAIVAATLVFDRAGDLESRTEDENQGGSDGL